MTTVIELMLINISVVFVLNIYQLKVQKTIYAHNCFPMFYVISVIPLIFLSMRKPLSRLPYFIILLIFYVWMKGYEILLISSKYTQHLVNRPPKKHSLVMMYPKLGFFYRITTGYIFSSFSILKIPFEMPYFSNQKTHLFT